MDLPAILHANASTFLIPLHVVAKEVGPSLAELVIASNAIAEPSLSITLSANVLSCDEVCDLDHAEAVCAAEGCAIGVCDQGFHDLDTDVTNGCECQEDQDGNDVGGVCSTGLVVGPLGDYCSNLPFSTTVTGTLHAEDDRDVYFFQTIDEGSAGCDVFQDSSVTGVELVDGPEGLAVCMRFKKAESGCGGYSSTYEPNYCSRTFLFLNGSVGRDDSTDVTVWVMWHPDAEPVCEPYTLKFYGGTDPEK